MPSLLVVEDDPDIRAMFVRAVAPLGDVHEAPDGEAAVRQLRSTRYDLVLLDLHMPVLDGFGVLDVLERERGPNEDTPVYVLTADPSEEARKRVMKRRGGVFFLSKPVNLAALVSLATAVLQRGRRSVAPPRRP